MPTVIESWYADYEHESWNGLLAPANTPNDMHEQLQSWLTVAGGSAEMKQKLAAQGLSPSVSCGAEFAAGLRRQYEQYGRAIRAANLKIPEPVAGVASIDRTSPATSAEPRYQCTTNFARGGT